MAGIGMAVAPWRLEASLVSPVLPSTLLSFSILPGGQGGGSLSEAGGGRPRAPRAVGGIGTQVRALQLGLLMWCLHPS